MMPSGLNKIYNTFSIIIKAFKTPMIFGTSLLLMLISCLSCSSVTTFYSHQYRRRRWHPLQCSCLENPMDGGARWAAVHGVAGSQTRLSDFIFTFSSHALEKEMATHSSVLAWRITGTGEPSGMPSMGSHRVRHDWSNLAAAAAAGLESGEQSSAPSCNPSAFHDPFWASSFISRVNCRNSWQNYHLGLLMVGVSLSI